MIQKGTISMDFIGRQKELKRLKEISSFAKTSGYLTLISGRRRVGKTTLVKHFIEQQKLKSCYFFVSRKQPKAILNEFCSILNEEFEQIAGLTFEDFDGFFLHIFKILQKKNFTFVFDEFQNFWYVDSSVFSTFQKHWDENKDNIKGHIIVIGSIQTLMNTIFEDQKEPLFKRLTGKILLKPFSISEMNELFIGTKSNDVSMNIRLQLLFNGIPFYYYLLEKEHLFNKSLIKIIDRLVLHQDSILFNEGRELTIEEFGRNYGRYFSILEAVARGYTQWNKIATQTGIPSNSIGKYFDELIQQYRLLERRHSVFSQKQSAKNGRYYLKDNFLSFWFRYVYKNLSVLEGYSAEKLIPKIREDLPNFFGYNFERFVVEWLQMQSVNNFKQFHFDEIGKYWDRAGNDIDIIAFKTDDELCLVGECKWNSKRITNAVINKLEQSVELVKKTRKFKNFQKAIFVGDKASSDIKNMLLRKDIQLYEISNYFG